MGSELPLEWAVAPVLQSDNGLILRSRQFWQAYRDYRLLQEFIMLHTGTERDHRALLSEFQEVVCLAACLPYIRECADIIRDWGRSHKPEAAAQRPLARFQMSTIRRLSMMR